jgi:hypothetical protein
MMTREDRDSRPRIPVLGAFGALAETHRPGSVDRVVISDARLEGEPLTELQALCSRHGVCLTR